jgi:hypothetical protein
MTRALAILGIALLAACKQTPTCDEARAGDTKPVDQGLVAYLSLASALHHEADLAESRNDGKGALGALTRLLDSKTPGSFAEVREVRSDTMARAAELTLHDGALDAAAGFLERGLQEVPEESYYRGRLFEVSGLLFEAQSKQLEDSGKLAEAEAKKREAIDRLEQAVRIQQAVIERATGPEKPQ